MEGEPGGYQGCDNDKKANIPEAAVQRFKMRDQRLAGLLAFLVFL
jgi:hypothetical protein